MRVSSESNDPDHWGKIFLDVPDIYLNGESIDHAVEADEEKGVVIVYQTNATGAPIYAGGQFLTNTLTGKVEIKGRKITNISQRNPRLPKGYNP